MGRLIVFAGLPGSGKSTLATALAADLQAVLLNKDVLRAALFAPEQVEYNSRQNDFCMDVLYQLVGYHLRHFPERTVIIDGRTYSKRYQVETLLEWVKQWGCEFYVLECQASLETLVKRVESDKESHLAKDRTVEMVRQAYEHWEQSNYPRLIVNTDKLNLAEAIELIQEFILTNETRPAD